MAHGYVSASSARFLLKVMVQLAAARISWAESGSLVYCYARQRRLRRLSSIERPRIATRWARRLAVCCPINRRLLRGIGSDVGMPSRGPIRRLDGRDVSLRAKRSNRREVIGAALSSFAFTASSRGADIKKGEGRVYGVEEDQPFRSTLEQIGSLLDRLGVEGVVEKPRAEPPPGPPIDRSYAVGLRPGTDRLLACPDGHVCLSSSRYEKAELSVSPYVYFDQKGDAVGSLIEALYGARDAQLLTARGNFFNGGGVYALAELTDRPPGQKEPSIHDVEFNFLPGVLESVVDVRITQREGPKADAGRQKFLLQALTTRLGWMPLRDLDDQALAELGKDRRDVVEASKTEMVYRDRFEEQMEKADAELTVLMEKERKRIEELKREVRELLDALTLQDDSRMNEYRELRSRSAQTRDEYERGVAERVGGYKNSGRYAPSQKVRLGNSFAGLINSKDDTLSKIYDQAQQEKARK